MTLLSRAQRGFSLVELLVGLVVGLIASGAIIQTFSTFEAQKRSTVAGSEAQENGLVALSLIEQDVHNAGIGIADPALLGCSGTQTYTYTSLSGGPIPNFSLAPLIVTPGSAVNQPDAIQVTSGDLLGALPSYTTQLMASPSDLLTVTRMDNFAVGDVVVVTDGSNCTLMQITALAPATTQLRHDASLGVYNPSASTSAGWPAYATGSRVLNPKAIVSNAYQITGGNLQLTSSTAAATPTVQAFSLVRNLVFMKAQYGVIDPAVLPLAVTWQTPTGLWAPTALAASPDRRKQIKAVRIAVVARSDKREAAAVTAPCTNVSLTVNQGPCAWVDTAANPAPVIDLSANPDWQHYRYRVYQTIVPLRNVIWDNV